MSTECPEAAKLDCSGAPHGKAIRVRDICAARLSDAPHKLIRVVLTSSSRGGRTGDNRRRRRPIACFTVVWKPHFACAGASPTHLLSLVLLTVPSRRTNYTKNVR